MIFVDTSALVALGNERDYYHSKAVELFRIYEQSTQPLLTTSGVLLEFMNTFGTLSLRSIGLALIDEILSSEQWTIAFIDQALIVEGITLFRQRMDKEWGLGDCVSMVVAKQNNIRDIMTADHHFEQAGFNCLLKQTQ